MEGGPSQVAGSLGLFCFYPLCVHISSMSQLHDTAKQRLQRERKSQSRGMLCPSLESLAGGPGYLVLGRRVLSEVPSGEQWSRWESLFLILGVTGCQVVRGGAQPLRQTPSRSGPKACHLRFSAFLLGQPNPSVSPQRSPVWL